MNKLVISTLALFCLVSVVNAEPKLKWFLANGNIFSVQAPSSWIKNKKSEYLSISSPNGNVSITASAYGKGGGSLSEFAKYRFSSVQSFYKPTTKIYKISNGVVQEYEGIWPNEKKPTYYTVAALKIGSMYMSITFVTDRNNFNKNKKLYMKILQTIKVNS